MNRFFKSSFLVVTVLLATGAVALPASARSVVAFAGRSRYVADATCFTEYGGGVNNTCASMKEYMIPLVVDADGANKSVYVSVFAASPSNTLGCYSSGVNWQNTSWWATTRKYPPSFGMSVWLSVPTYVPTDGALFVRCEVNPGGLINNVWFTPS